MENMNSNDLLFAQLVASLYNSGLQALGKIAVMGTNEIKVDLNQAKATIDMLDMIKIKTKGNLSSDEESYLIQVISQLKLNYVDVANSTEKEESNEKKEENIEKKEEKTDNKEEHTESKEEKTEEVNHQKDDISNKVSESEES